MRRHLNEQVISFKTMTLLIACAKWYIEQVKLFASLNVTADILLCIHLRATRKLGYDTLMSNCSAVGREI